MNHPCGLRSTTPETLRKWLLTYENAPRARHDGPRLASCNAGPGRVTETVKFLVWLHETYQRTATQQDVDEWLATGPTTRSAIRTFFVLAKKVRLNTQVTIQHRAAQTSRSLSQDQRLAWIHEPLTGTSESLPYRVAGMLLLYQGASRLASQSPSRRPPPAPEHRHGPTP